MSEPPTPTPIPAALVAQLRAGKAVVVAGVAAPLRDELAALTGELAAHAVEVVVVDDDRAVLAWLAALRDACRDGSDEPAPETLDQTEQEARDRENWPLLIEVIMARIEHAGGAAERARWLRELAELYEIRLDDPRRAFTAIITACHVAPEDDEAVRIAERLAAATGRWADLVGETAELATDGRDPELASRWWTRLAGWYATRLGDPGAAIQRYEAAVAMDGSVTALEALAELYGDDRAADRERTLERLAGEPGKRGERARTRLLDLELARGAAAREAGELDAAEAAYRRALARDPRHDGAVQALAELAGERGDWRAVVEHRRAQLEALSEAPGSEARRARLHEQLGDVWREPLADPGAAIAAYQHALALVPSGRGVLHKLLEAFSQQRQWRRAIEMLERLAAHEPSPERRARFHYAAAMIARDELDDSALALDKLAVALDDAPLTPHAFDAFDALLTARGDWKQLARAFRRQLTRVADAAPPETLLALWTRLGDLCLDQLDDREAATAAYQVAGELAPDDAARHEQLVELYLAAGSARRREAIVELQWLIGRSPNRVELYKALAPLYVAERELDKAWCVAQVLVFLGAASDDEHALFERFRAPGFAPAARRLTEELWHKAITHPAEDRELGAVFAATGPAIAPAQPIRAFGLAPDDRIDLVHDARALPRIVRDVADVLAIEPAPMVWRSDGDGLRVANTLGERARPVPSLLVGALPTSPDERALAFEVGKRLAYLRPERFVALAIATLPRLEAGFAAVRRASQPDAPADGPIDAQINTPVDADGLVARLRAGVPALILEQVGALAASVAERPDAVAAWRAATDLTANRAGFVVANDLETAARAIATEGTTLSGLAVHERLSDLLGYAASERYFAVRRHLGQQVRLAPPPADVHADAPIGDP